MGSLISRVLIIVELLLALVVVLGLATTLLMAPIFAAAEGTSIPLLAKWDLVIACVSVIPVFYLALGYLRSGAGEFVIALDAPWCIAGVGSLGLAAIGMYGLARFSDVGAIPFVTAVLVIPFAHAAVAGVVTRRLTIGSSDRGVSSSVSQGGSR
jgi:hypothetical protein